MARVRTLVNLDVGRHFIKLEENVSPLEQFDTDLGACRKCEGILYRKFVGGRVSDERVQPRPIVSGLRQRPIMLIGQAPGLTEYQTGKSFQGPAGQEIRAVFAECGVTSERFPRVVQTSAVVKCFPGSKLVPSRRKPGVHREDEKPSATMIKNCRPLLERQIVLCDPDVIVLLGGLPLQVFLRMSGAVCTKAELAAFVGRIVQWGKRKVIPFPHTSGSSFWLNDPANRQLFAAAKSLLRREVASLSGA